VEVEIVVLDAEALVGEQPERDVETLLAGTADPENPSPCLYMVIRRSSSSRLRSIRS